jgi:hypothetical protein
MYVKDQTIIKGGTLVRNVQLPGWCVGGFGAKEEDKTLTIRLLIM